MNQKITQIQHHLQQIQNLLQQLQQETTPTPQQTPQQTPQTQINHQDPNWPQATPPNTIIQDNDEPAKKYRAAQIITQININPKNKTILDYGTGQAHLPHQLTHQGATKTIAYDPNPQNHPNWNNNTQNTITTQNPQTINQHAPYHLIILYDTIDHLQTTQEITNTLKQLKQHLHPQGTIYIHTHPWTSKTGAHQYTTHNKHHYHLTLTPEQYQQHQQQHNWPHTLKITRPTATYTQAIKQANLTIKKQQPNTDPQLPPHIQQLLPHIIQNTWGTNNITTEQAQKILTLNSIDYWLTH